MFSCLLVLVIIWHNHKTTVDVEKLCYCFAPSLSFIPCLRSEHVRSISVDHGHPLVEEAASFQKYLLANSTFLIRCKHLIRQVFFFYVIYVKANCQLPGDLNIFSITNFYLGFRIALRSYHTDHHKIPSQIYPWSATWPKFKSL